MNTTQVISRRSYFKAEPSRSRAATRQAHPPAPVSPRTIASNRWRSTSSFSVRGSSRGEWRYVDLGTHTAQCVNGNDVCAGARAEFSNALMLGLVGAAYKF